MFKKIVANILIVLVTLPSLGFASEEELKVLYVGTPQAGPPIILTKAFAQNLKISNSFVSIQDCASVISFIEKNPNVAFIVSDMTTLTLRSKGINCIPNFKPEDIIGTMASSWHICKKTGGREMGQKRFTLGVSTVLPATGVVRDFNKRNGVNAVPVGLASSSQVVAALLSGDIDWGMINPGVAEPLIQEGKLECPLTFIPQGTSLVSNKAYIANHYDMSVPDLRCTYLLILKSKDIKIREAVLDAAQSKNFNTFLDKTSYFNVKTGNFTQKDVDSFNSYINHVEKELY